MATDLDISEDFLASSNSFQTLAEISRASLGRLFWRAIDIGEGRDWAIAVRRGFVKDPSFFWIQGLFRALAHKGSLQVFFSLSPKLLHLLSCSFLYLDLPEISSNTGAGVRRKVSGPLGDFSSLLDRHPSAS